ncbi:MULTISPECIES: LysM peptidoglycan-binding domain-containing protein [unclassified Bacillus (in: firmicutes)]|uniref:LysM peptidoglycan-binding domain-containing protein n=1 Tax=unclassified Bacillus (in: firmicutes) TaxID=185979 RepID=UPI0013EEC643|nr:MULTISPECIES: LysM peptidoglycan-binding domain-containing protein [unclassified Bacillus (in: firmicutes)]KAF6547927.1 LysM peptidoglycan-binding domain-containing protein [Bacillus sp. EKM207B]KAF6549000.1 LysM peptidoglycan-binding domain-containing protein [Bacillus sp. EKM206B]KAF6555992.1 LysM peptidoglycan-binding domain-containing protein [Bacillus sp. EKM203B]
MPHNHRLQFSVEESICFQKGQEVSELLSISLDPDIRVQEVNDYVSIKGSLELTGEYNIDHSSHFEELNRELRHVEEVRAREDGTAELIHCFPVDITIPKNKVSHLNDVFVFIDAFDYQLTDSRILTIQADLAIEGLLEESEPKEPEIPLYVAPEFAREEMINLAGHHSEDENEPELMIRHQPEIPLSVSKEAAQETEKNEEETPPLLRQEEEEQETAPILREREEEEQEAEPILREREEEEQEAEPILREREEEEQEAAPILREQEEEEQEAAPILREHKEEEEETAPILREHKEEEEETAPILREREEEEQETAPVLREHEEVPKPVSFTEPPPPVSFQHEEKPEEAEEPAIMSAVRNEPVFEDDSAEVQEEPKDDNEPVFPAFTLTPHAEKPKIAEQPFLQKEEQPEAEPLLRQSDHEAAEDEDEPAVFQEEQAPVYREFVPERQEEEFYSAPKLLEEEAHDEEGFEIEVRKMAQPEEETGKPLDLSFQFSKLSPEEPAQAEPPEPLKSERKNEEAAPGTEQKENDNSHYLTKLFTREEEKFSRMKICIVQQQDTIDRVCERYDITSQQLIRTNALSFDDELEEGQLLYIPEYNNSHA